MRQHGTPSSSYAFRLIIDGCNGPIRFREHQLRRVAAPGAEGNRHHPKPEEKQEEEQETYDEDADGNPSGASPEGAEHTGSEEDDEILSFLCPESIAEGWQFLQRERKSQTDKKKNRSHRGKKRAKGKPKGHRNTVKTNLGCVEGDNKNNDCWHQVKSSNRMDMVPLLHKLLDFSSGRDCDRSCCFESATVIFDGVSITKRPSVPGAKHGTGEDDNDNDQSEIREERVWNVYSNTSASPRIKGNGTNGIDKSPLTVEVTGLFDEADNVIVDRIQECAAVRAQRRCEESGESSPNRIRNVGACNSRIHIIRRTDRGAGKNRTAFRHLGLLRPDSVACVFDLLCAVDSTGNNGTVASESKEKNYSSLSQFHSLALDGDRTLRSLRQNNPGNVFLCIDEPQEVEHEDVFAEGSSERIGEIVLPIVATDDIFLRQRIVKEGGYVMTFHQLWLLLLDA